MLCERNKYAIQHRNVLLKTVAYLNVAMAKVHSHTRQYLLAFSNPKDRFTHFDIEIEIG